MRVNGIRVADFASIPAHREMSGDAVVLGTSKNWAGELLDALRFSPDANLFAVNKAGNFVLSNYRVTVHPEDYFNPWNPAPLFSDKQMTTTWKCSDGQEAKAVDYVWPIPTAGGTSALLATMIAFVMGFDRVIMAGVHLIGEYRRFRDRWLYFEDDLMGRVVSVSPEGTFIRDHFGGINDA